MIYIYIYIYIHIHNAHTGGAGDRDRAYRMFAALDLESRRRGESGASTERLPHIHTEHSSLSCRFRPSFLGGSTHFFGSVSDHEC